MGSPSPRSYALVLAFAFFPQRASAAAPQSACARDIATYCAAAPAGASSQELSRCTDHYWGRLSAPCRDEIINATVDPCLKVASQLCRNVADHVSRGRCIRSNIQGASETCKKRLETIYPGADKIRAEAEAKAKANAKPGTKAEVKAAAVKIDPCASLAAKFCPDARGGAEKISCLLGHVDGISTSCLSNMRVSRHWPGPCLKDEERLCPGGLNAMEKRECKLAHLSELSPLCRKVFIRLNPPKP